MVSAPGRHRRHRRPAHPSSRRALWGSAAAGRGRAGADLAPGGRVRRRALGPPRLEILERRARAAAPCRRRLLANSRDGHARRPRGVVRRPAAGARRRTDRARWGGRHGRAGARPHEVSGLMLSLVLRGFMQRKLRVLLTGIAIALGVALMAGTYVLTDTINRSFAGIFKTAHRGHDVVILPT